MRIAAAETELAEGDLVIISALDHDHLHLLRPLEATGRGMTLEQCLRRDGIPSTWTSHCGVHGGTWHYREHLFGRTRRVCPACIRAGHAVAAA